MLSQQQHLEPWWWNSAVVTCYGLLLLNLVASLAKRLVRLVNTALAVTFVIALVLWIPAVVGSEWLVAERPWPWFLMTVATVAAAVAFPTWLATTYLFVLSLLYGVLRITVYGGAAEPSMAALDVVYAILLGGAALVIITMLRAAAASVDAAQATALNRYLQAVREHATEVERVRVDAIVHDTVLTTFLTAARAETPEERALAASLARNAIRHLRDAEVSGPYEDTTVGVESVVKRIHAAQGAMLAPFSIDASGAGDVVIASSAAEAIYGAALQAMVNSLQHAGDSADIRRWVVVRERPGGGVQVEVGDNGVGFSVDEIPPGRLGVRVSIIERMIGVGGSATIESAPGTGTVVLLDWQPAGASAEDRGSAGAEAPPVEPSGEELP